MNIQILTITLLLSSSLSAVSADQSNGFDDPNNQILSSDTFSIRKHTLSSGGGVSTGGSFTLTSSIAQIDAGHNASGSGFTIKGGFLQQHLDLIFKNGFE